jgi:hypothetical protein
MTDRELLEAAAKAAGKKVHTRNQADRDACGAGDVGLWISEGQTCWNPLTDDGDALRLAVKADIDVVQMGYATRADYMIGIGFCTAEVPHGTDPYAATRRAIVRAAAEIGRSMK